MIPAQFNRFQKQSLLFIIGALLMILLGGLQASAAIQPSNSVESITDLYANNGWEDALQGYALTLFWLLAGIQFLWAAIRLVLQGAEFDEWVAEIVRQILYIGFFLTLLLHSSEWARDIVNSFRTAADSANGTTGGMIGITPGVIIKIGYNLAIKMMNSMAVMNMLYSITLVLGAIITLICFALMAALLVVALVESYLVISAGVLLMGFGGSQWTNQYALNIYKYAISVGAKLFILQLLIGLGQRMMMTWVTAMDPNNIGDVLAIVASSVVFLALTKIIPDMVQGLVNGSSFSASNPLIGAGAAIGAGVAAVGTAALGAGYTAGGAVALASEQVKTSEATGTGPASNLERAAAFTGNVMKNIGKSSIEDIGGRLSGFAHWGTPGGRMGYAMHQQAKEMANQRNKPQEPPISVGSANNPNSNNDPGNVIYPAD